MKPLQPILRGLARILHGQGAAVGGGLLFLLLQPAAMLPVAWLVKKIFDTYLPERNEEKLLLAGLAILVLLGLAQGLSLLGHHWVTHAIKSGANRLREDFFAKIHLLPRSYYDGHDKFRLHDTIVNDVERVDNLANALVSRLLPAGIVALILAALAAVLNGSLFVVVALLFPVVYLLNRAMQRHHVARVTGYRRDFTAASRGVMMTLRHVDLIRLYATETLERERQRVLFSQATKSGIKVSWGQEAYLSVQQYTLVGLTLAILVVGGTSVIRGGMSVGALLSFYAVIGMLANSLREVATGLNQTMLGYDSLLRVLQLVELEPQPPYRGTRRIAFSGETELRDVEFSYQGETGAALLAGVQLRLQPGRISALVGPNGAGKSTIVHLLLGLYRPRHGGLFADGQPYDELDLTDLRRQIGIVAQDPVIFEGTIRDNIVYGHPTATEEDVRRAARLATADDFISRLPEGYATRVGDAGTLLSGGQRQRIAIARALIRRPTLLVFDEPTNHLDAGAANSLLRNLRSLTPAPCILVVTHNATVLPAADAVYQVADGRLARVETVPVPVPPPFPDEPSA